MNMKYFFLKENKESGTIFGNISFVKIEFSKLINYSTKHVSKWPGYSGMHLWI